MRRFLSAPSLREESPLALASSDAVARVAASWMKEDRRKCFPAEDKEWQRCFPPKEKRSLVGSVLEEILGEAVVRREETPLETRLSALEERMLALEVQVQAAHERSVFDRRSETLKNEFDVRDTLLRCAGELAGIGQMVCKTEGRLDALGKWCAELNSSLQSVRAADGRNTMPAKTPFPWSPVTNAGSAGEGSRTPDVEKAASTWYESTAQKRFGRLEADLSAALQEQRAFATTFAEFRSVFDRRQLETLKKELEMREAMLRCAGEVSGMAQMLCKTEGRLDALELKVQEPLALRTLPVLASRSAFCQVLKATKNDPDASEPNTDKFCMLRLAQRS